MSAEGATTPDFVTYFDVGYLSRGLALYESLQRNAPGSRLFAVCMDDEAFEVLERMDLPGFWPIRRSDFEAADPGLAGLAEERTLVEYYFSCTPSVILHVLKTHSDIEQLFYVDADVCFFAPIQQMLEDMGEGSVYVVAHRFPESQRHLEIYGLFNVGVVGFRNDDAGLGCLSRWREQCIEWCFDRLEGDRFADQKYLDRWPDDWPNVVVAEHPGVNAAPWNKANWRISDVDGSPQVNDRPLICYHFHGLRFHDHDLIELQAVDYGSQLSEPWMRLVYAPYLESLERIDRSLSLASKSIRYSGPRGLREVWRLRHSRNLVLRTVTGFHGLDGWRGVLTFWRHRRRSA